MNKKRREMVGHLKAQGLTAKQAYEQTKTLKDIWKHTPRAKDETQGS